MQRLAVGILRPEMVAAVDVFDSSGKSLIRAGTAFQESHIQALVENGFKSAYVSLSPFTAAAPEPILGTDLQKEGLKLIRQVYTDFIKGEADGTPIRDFASRLMNQVVIKRTTPFQWIDLRSTDDYLTAHVLNVAVLSILIGLKSEYTPTRLHELAVGA